MCFQSTVPTHLDPGCVRQTSVTSVSNSPACIYVIATRPPPPSSPRVLHATSQNKNQKQNKGNAGVLDDNQAVKEHEIVL